MEFVEDKLFPVLQKVPGLRNALPTRQQYARMPWVAEVCMYSHEDREEKRAQHVVSKFWFNSLVCVLTCLCAFMLGYELDNSGGVPLKDRLGYFMMDIFFALFFLFEMFGRQHQMGWDYFNDLWNIFDYSLVVMNFSDILISMTAQDGGFQMAASLRVVRMLRIAKSIEGIQALAGMWLVIQGLLNALKTMVWTGLLMIIIVYSISIVFMTIVADDPLVKDRWVDKEQYIGSVFRTLLTIVQVFTLDSWASDIARPLAMIGNWAAVVLFIATIVICNMGVLNIIISLMVEKISEMKKDSEQRNGKILAWVESKILKFIRDDFGKAFADKGELDYRQFKSVLSQPEVSYKFRLMGISPEEADTFFGLMDVSKDGVVSMDEFCEGMKRIRGPAQGIDIVALISFAHKQARMTKDFLSQIRRMNAKADVMQARLDVMGAVIESESGARERHQNRTKQVWHSAERRADVLKNLEKNRRCQFPQLLDSSDDELG